MTPQCRRPRVGLLVTDLDNTLYDWFAMWHASFSPMLDAICQRSQIPAATLLREIRAIHQERGTSEYLDLVNELPSLTAVHPGQDISIVYRDIIRRYRSERKRNLRLYPTVMKSLLRVKRCGVPIVAYTESLASPSAWRLRKLRLDGIIDYLYSPSGYGFPEGAEGITVKPPGSREARPSGLKYTAHRCVSRGVFKPDTEVLRQILADTGTPAAEVVYIGDSLMKDVAMAQQAGVLDVLAGYGAVTDDAQYDLLRQVSHWTEADVDRERKLSAGADIVATYVLQHKFAEIFELFTFRSQRDRTRAR